MCTHSIDNLLPHAPLHCAATGETIKGSYYSNLVEVGGSCLIRDHLISTSPDFLISLGSSPEEVGHDFRRMCILLSHIICNNIILFG